MQDGNHQANGNETLYCRYPAKRRGTWIAAALLALIMAPLALLATKTLPQELPEEALVRRLMGLDDRSYVPVLPVMETEDIWALEDAREQAGKPLIAAMKNGEDALGYDAAQETFYCTLGLETGNAWPEIALSASGEDGVQVVLVDDYSYDWCSEAIREGYRYELFAYTETEYAYVGIVFTGLPIVTLHVDGGVEITREDVSAQVSFSGAGYDAVHSSALIHERGGGWEHLIDKKGYRVELHTLSAKGKDKKNEQSVLGMEADCDWLLIASPDDESCIRNQLSFELWRDWNGGEGVMMLEGRLAELFIDDEYMGVYQVLEPVRADEEIVRMGGNLNTDVTVRKINPFNTGYRPTWDLEHVIDSVLELRYAPAQMTAEQAFAVMEGYVSIEGLNCEALDDKTFAEAAEMMFDMEEVMSYFLFIQALCGSKDNAVNNVYIWARKQNDGHYTYTFSPWDMDNMFVWLSESGVGSHEMQEVDRINFLMTAFDRMLDLNVGDCRRILWEIWEEKRASILSDDALYQRIVDMEEMINASGAYLRESERWRGGAKELDVSDILSLATTHQATLEWYMEELWPLEP